MDPFQVLPDETLVRILSYLSHQELTRVSHVSLLWNSLARENMLWKALFERRFKDKNTDCEALDFGDAGDSGGFAECEAEVSVPRTSSKDTRKVYASLRRWPWIPYPHKAFSDFVFGDFSDFKSRFVLRDKWARGAARLTKWTGIPGESRGQPAFFRNLLLVPYHSPTTGSCVAVWNATTKTVVGTHPCPCKLDQTDPLTMLVLDQRTDAHGVKGLGDGPIHEIDGLLVFASGCLQFFRFRYVTGVGRSPNAECRAPLQPSATTTPSATATPTTPSDTTVPSDTATPSAAATPSATTPSDTTAPSDTTTPSDTATPSAVTTSLEFTCFTAVKVPVIQVTLYQSVALVFTADSRLSMVKMSGNSLSIVRLANTYCCDPPLTLHLQPPKVPTSQVWTAWVVTTSFVGPCVAELKIDVSSGKLLGSVFFRVKSWDPGAYTTCLAGDMQVRLVAVGTRRDTVTILAVPSPNHPCAIDRSPETMDRVCTVSSIFSTPLSVTFLSQMPGKLLCGTRNGLILAWDLEPEMWTGPAGPLRWAQPQPPLPSRQLRDIAEDRRRTGPKPARAWAAPATPLDISWVGGDGGHVVGMGASRALAYSFF